MQNNLIESVFFLAAAEALVSRLITTAVLNSQTVIIQDVETGLFTTGCRIKEEAAVSD